MLPNPYSTTFSFHVNSIYFVLFFEEYDCRYVLQDWRKYCFYLLLLVYTPCFRKKLDPLLFHHICASTATNCMKISRSTWEVVLVVNMERMFWLVSHSLLITVIKYCLCVNLRERSSPKGLTLGLHAWNTLCLTNLRPPHSSITPVLFPLTFRLLTTATFSL